MIGMDRRTGRTISGTQQLASRLQQVFTTQRAARNRRRAFGCQLPSMLGHNVNHGLLLSAKAEMFDALIDPKNGCSDFNANNIQLQATEAGFIAELKGRYRGEDITVRVPLNDDI